MSLRTFIVQNIPMGSQILNIYSCDVVLLDGTGPEGAWTRMYFRPEMENAVAITLEGFDYKEVKSSSGFVCFHHDGHTALQMVNHFEDYPLDLQDAVLAETLAGLAEEARYDWWRDDPSRNTMCLQCGKHYRKDIGFCPDCASEAGRDDYYPPLSIPEPEGPDRSCICKKHQITYYYEDGCPECEAELEAIEYEAGFGDGY